MLSNLTQWGTGLLIHPHSFTVRISMSLIIIICMKERLHHGLLRPELRHAFSSGNEMHGLEMSAS
jgi:hypothetical protein